MKKTLYISKNIRKATGFFSSLGYTFDTVRTERKNGYEWRHFYKFMENGRVHVVLKGAKKFTSIYLHFDIKNSIHGVDSHRCISNELDRIEKNIFEKRVI